MMTQAWWEGEVLAVLDRMAELLDMMAEDAEREDETP